MHDQVNICDLAFGELEAFVTGELGLPRFRTLQIWQWIWRRNARAFDDMTDIAKDVRVRLAERCRIVWPEISLVRKSEDGTVKFLLRLADGEHVETVLIPSTDKAGTTRIHYR